MTETEICNMALGRVGAKRLNNYETDASTEGRLCRLQYPQTLKSLLRSFDWSFARKRATLSEDTDDPLFEWDHQYVLPSDFSRLLMVNEFDISDGLEDRWTIEGKRILTNYDTMNIVYIRDGITVNEFDPLFIDTLVLRLALKIIPPHLGTKSSPFYAEIKDDLKVTEYRARAVCSQEVNVTGREALNLARYDS